MNLWVMLIKPMWCYPSTVVDLDIESGIIKLWVIYCRIKGQNSFLDFFSKNGSVFVCNSKCINDTNEGGSSKS